MPYREVNLKAIVLARVNESDSDNLANFDCVTDGDDDVIAAHSRTMNEFLQIESIQQQSVKMSTTILLYYTGHLAAYVSICTDAIQLKDDEAKEEGSRKTAPAIKIARLAVDKNWRGYGFGELLIEYVRDLCNDLSDKVGVRYITLDAFPHRVSYYEKLGFRKNLAFAKRTHQISMRSDYYAAANSTVEQAGESVS